MVNHYGQSSPSTYDIKDQRQNRAENRLPQTPLLVEIYKPVANVSPVPHVASGTCEVASNTTCRYVRYFYVLYIPT